MKTTVPSTPDDINDLAIAVLDDLVAAGLVPDCTDTDDESEFAVQDVIAAALAKRFGVDLLNS